MPNTYAVSLFDCQVAQSDKDAAIIKFREVLAERLGTESDVAAAYVAYDTAFQAHGETPLPSTASCKEVNAVVRWEAAEAAATTAAFAGWHGTIKGTLGGAHFEVTVL